MALTLVEASKMNRAEVKRSAIIEMFAKNTDLLRVMQFMDVPGQSYAYTQEGSLPGVAFRGINEAYVGSTGILNPQVEVMRIIGGELDVDQALVRTHGEGVRNQQEKGKIKALALNITKNFILGDSAVNPRIFDGLRNRINGSQLIPGGATAGGDALSLAKLDEAIDIVDAPTHLIMSKAHRRRLSRAAANTAVGGYIEWDKDMFGERVGFYNDLPILIADYDEAGARIIDFNEANPGGGAAVGSSIYVVSIGDGMLSGIQNGTMDVEDLGRLQSAPVYRTRVEWIVGLVALHGRCASRLSGIKDAAVTL